jgi:hypothetical protein
MSEYTCGGARREYACGNGEKSEGFTPGAAHGGPDQLCIIIAAFVWDTESRQDRLTKYH